MPKNQTGGSGHKKQRNAPSQRAGRKLDNIAKNPEDGEVYGKIARALGSRRFAVECQEPDNPGVIATLNCSLKGSIKSRASVGDYVLVQVWPLITAGCKGSIIDVYKKNEVDGLKRAGLWDLDIREADGAGSLEEGHDALEEQEEQEEQATEQAGSFTVKFNELKGPSGSADLRDFDIDAI